MKAKQIVRRLLKKYSQKESPILAITGDHGNNIAVPNRTGYIYARLPNGDVVQVYNSIAPLALDIDITIGFNPKDPNLLQVTSIIGARGRYGGGDVQKVGPLSHHKSHEWMANSGATDVVFSELRQFMPFRPTPEGGMSLHVNRGVAWINDAWQHTSGSSIDFAPYVTDMVSGTAQYALAYLDSSGVPDFIIGSGNLTAMSALTLDDIPDHYPGTVPIAAIKLRGNQTGIVEAKSYTDLIDLRFPFRHDHPFTDLDDVPHNYSGQVGKAVVVNNTENGLDFVSVVTGSGGIVGASDVTVDDSGGHYTGTNVETVLQESGVNVDYMKNFFNGSFIESFDALVTSDGAIITMSLEQSGSGNLIMRFSDGFTTLDCTPAKTIALTAGSDTSPQENFIYIPQSTKILTKSTSDWPTTEHIKVSYFLVPSAGFTQTNGVYVNQNWNDHRMDTSNMGHMAHMAERSRRLGAIYTSGIAGSGTDGYLTPTASNVELKSTAGIVFQMHRHTVPVFDTSTSGTVLVKNWSGDSYHDITNLFDITADSGGNTIGSNRYFNLVIWAVANKSGEYTPKMINLPSGFYTLQSSAENDVSGYDDFTMPSEYSINSSTGFLIARVTIKMNTTWEVISTKDLRGTTPQSASGGGGGTATEFADNTFKIFDETDSTKEVQLQVSGVSTGTTRTLGVPDASGRLVIEDNELAGQLIFANSAVISPFSVTEQSSPPSSPVAEDVYMDDGSNTASGNPGWRRYTGAVWEDVSAGAGGAGAVATDTIWDQAGDLAVGTGSNSAIRLPVGTDTHILTADSGEPSGVKWAAAASGGGDVVADLINSEVSLTGTATLTSAAFGKMHVCSGTAANYTVTLPAVSGNGGKTIGFRMATGLTRLVTIDGNGTETIDGALSRIMWAHESATLLCDGTTWIKIAGRTIPMMAIMKRTTAQSIPQGAWTQVILTTAVDDNTSGLVEPCADTSNGYFVVRRPGYYTASGFVYFPSGLGSATVVYGGCSITLGSASNPNATQQFIVGAGGDAAVSASGSFLCAVSETLITQVYQGDAAENTSTSANTQPTLSVVEIPSW